MSIMKLGSRVESFIGEKLRNRRLELGYSRAKLAELVGLAAKTIKSYELGESKPGMKILERIAAELNAECEYFCDATTEDDKDDPLAADSMFKYIQEKRERLLKMMRYSY